jgi:hypothetical protein
LQEDIEKKRHKRDPFASKYVTLATSEFGGLALQVGALLPPVPLPLGAALIARRICGLSLWLQPCPFPG